jgi:hypothetical protein
MKKEELEELSMSNLDKVLRALDKGDIKEAKQCAITMEKEAKMMHDVMVNFASILLTYIGKTFGEEEIAKALRFRHDTVERDQKKMLSMDPEDAVRHKALIHRGHHSTATFTEEKDRYVLKLNPCNSGGLMLRQDVEKPGNLGRIKKGVPESWSRSGVSYYCMHCAGNSIVSVERGAPHPTWICERSDDPMGPCYQYFYKRTEDVPEKYFTELGLKKPAKAKK